MSDLPPSPPVDPDRVARQRHFAISLFRLSGAFIVMFGFLAIAQRFSWVQGTKAKAFGTIMVLTGLFQSCFGRMPPCDTWQEWMRQFGRAVWDAQQDAKFATLLILTTSLDEQHFQSSVDVTRAELARYDADQEQLFYVQSAVQALATGWAVLANAPYAEKIDRMFDLRAGALASIDALVESWSARVSRGKPIAV